MNLYLHVRIGPYPVLLDAHHVLEVLDLEPDDEQGVAGFRQWREQALVALNMRVLLGLNETQFASRHSGVVYAGDGSGIDSKSNDAVPIMLELDEVTCLHKANERDLLPLPEASPSMARLFDGVLLDALNGIWFYHLRSSLTAAELSQ